jgi:hypothetical protein
VIDIGVAFRVHAGSVTSCGGRVVVVGPGRPCLACWGHIDPERLRIEALDEASRAAEAQLGYVDGADVPAPSVMAFNVAASGMAVIEFLRLVTGFAGADSPPNRLGFQFASGEVVRNTVAARTGCPYCGRSMSS